MMNDHLQPNEIAGFCALSDERRGVALDHLGECAACRGTWLADDGSRVFSLLARSPIPEDRLEQLSERVDAALGELQPRVAARRGLFRVASIAASLLLAAVLGAVLWNHEWPAERLARVGRIEALLPLDEEIAGMQVVETPSEDAQTLSLKVGETQILMIFDESIEL